MQNQYRDNVIIDQVTNILKQIEMEELKKDILIKSKEMAEFTLKWLKDDPSVTQEYLDVLRKEIELTNTILGNK